MSKDSKNHVPLCCSVDSQTVQQPISAKGFCFFFCSSSERKFEDILDQFGIKESIEFGSKLELPSVQS